MEISREVIIEELEKLVDKTSEVCDTIEENLSPQWRITSIDGLTELVETIEELREKAPEFIEELSAIEGDITEEQLEDREIKTLISDIDFNIEAITNGEER